MAGRQGFRVEIFFYKLRPDILWNLVKSFRLFFVILTDVGHSFRESILA